MMAEVYDTGDEIFFGSTDAPLPDWRKHHSRAILPDDVDEDESDDADDDSEEDFQALKRVLGFDPRDYEDKE